MAIKQRKQLTGTTAQINAYAGVEGQLVWDKTKKKWVGMSGTAGTNYPMASESHTHSISNVTNLQSTLDGKQPKGDYATNSALTTGLAGKLDATGKAQTAGTADTANALASTAKVPYSQLTGTPSIPDASKLIPRGGDGGIISVYETQRSLSSGGSIGLGSPSILVVNPGTPPSPVTIGINAGQDEKGATKLLYVFNASSVTFTPITGVGLSWANGIAPTFKAHNIVVLTFHNSNTVFASLVSAWDN